MAHGKMFLIYLAVMFILTVIVLLGKRYAFIDNVTLPTVTVLTFQTDNRTQNHEHSLDIPKSVTQKIESIALYRQIESKNRTARVSIKHTTIPKQEAFGIDVTRLKTPFERLQTITDSREFQQLFQPQNEMLGQLNISRVLALTKILSDKTGTVGKPHLKVKLSSMGKRMQNKLQTPQSKLVTEVLGRKTGGTFIECGAFDGETASNTLELEFFYGWSGLLIEPNPFYYTQVLGKNRNLHALNACLSTRPVPTLMHMNLLGCAQTCKTTDIKETSKNSIPVPCLPFPLVLQSLNISTVDYFSLDVEGAEYDVLQTIPFDKLDIKTLSVEYKHDVKSKEDIVTFMDGQGYHMYKELYSSDAKRLVYVEDLFFVKKSLMATAKGN